MSFHMFIKEQFGDKAYQGRGRLRPIWPVSHRKLFAFVTPADWDAALRELEAAALFGAPALFQTRIVGDRYPVAVDLQLLANRCMSRALFWAGMGRGGVHHG